MQIIDSYNYDQDSLYIEIYDENFVRTYLPDIPVVKFYEDLTLIARVNKDKTLSLIINTGPNNEGQYEDNTITVNKNELIKLLIRVRHANLDNELLDDSFNPYLSYDYDRNLNKYQLQRLAIIKTLEF